MHLNEIIVCVLWFINVYVIPCHSGVRSRGTLSQENESDEDMETSQENVEEEEEEQEEENQHSSPKVRLLS